MMYLPQKLINFRFKPVFQDKSKVESDQITLTRRGSGVQITDLAETSEQVLDIEI